MHVILFLIVFIFLIGLGFTNTSVYAQNQIQVSVTAGSAAPGCEESKICFSPYSIRVNAGETVTWSNDDTAAHTVTSGHPGNPDGVFDSSLFMAGSTFSHTFDQPGTFHYFCIIHPWMEGEVIVENSSNSQTFTKTTSNEIGSAQLDQSIYHINQNENSLVKIFGTISNPLKESKVEIIITDPENSSDGSSVITTDNGYYELFFPLDYDSPEGTYKVLVSYSSSIIGQMTFDVIQESQFVFQNNETETLATENVVIVEKEIPAPFVDTTKDPSYYVKRYLFESDYKDWFERNYPDYTFYEAIGISESEFLDEVKLQTEEENLQKEKEKEIQEQIKTIRGDWYSRTLQPFAKVPSSSEILDMMGKEKAEKYVEFFEGLQSRNIQAGNVELLLSSDKITLEERKIILDYFEDALIVMKTFSKDRLNEYDDDKLYR